MRYIHVDGDLALRESQLHPAVGQRREHQQTTGVPGPEGQTHGQSVAVTLARQPQEGRGVEEDGEEVGLGAGERQVTLVGNRTEPERGINVVQFWIHESEPDSFRVHTNKLKPNNLLIQSQFLFINLRFYKEDSWFYDRKSQLHKSFIFMIKDSRFNDKKCICSHSHAVFAILQQKYVIF